MRPAPFSSPMPPADRSKFGNPLAVLQVLRTETRDEPFPAADVDPIGCASDTAASFVNPTPLGTPACDKPRSPLDFPCDYYTELPHSSLALRWPFCHLTSKRWRFRRKLPVYQTSSSSLPTIRIIILGRLDDFLRILRVFLIFSSSFQLGDNWLKLWPVGAT